MRTTKATTTRLAPLIAFFLVTVSVCAAQVPPSVEKVEPPNWWAGHSINPVRVLVRGKNLSGARVEAVGGGIRTGLVRVNERGTYRFVDVSIESNARLSERKLRCISGGGLAARTV